MLRTKHSFAIGDWIGSSRPYPCPWKPAPRRRHQSTTCLVYSPDPAWPCFFHSLRNMEAARGAALLLFILALAKPTPHASAPERFVTVSPEGDFMLGCQKFLVAGWNQLSAGAQRLRPALSSACLVRGLVPAHLGHLGLSPVCPAPRTATCLAPCLWYASQRPPCFGWHIGCTTQKGKL